MSNDSDLLDEADAANPRATGPLRTAIEFIGAHPFATGLLAILGVVGFILSFAGFLFDREEAAQTTEQIADVGDDVTIIRDRMEQPCSRTPCWGLEDIAQFSTLGRPKELIEGKLPLPETGDAGSTIYNVDGCEVRIEFVDDTVVYFAIAVEKTPASGSSAQAAGEPCNFDPADLALQPLPDLPPLNELTFRDILPAVTTLEAGDYVLDGGNMMRPHFNFFEQGAQSQNSRRLYFETRFASADTSNSSPLGPFRNALDEMEERNVNWRGNPRKGVCEARLNDAVSAHLSDVRITAIGLGLGQRALDASGESPLVVCP